MGAWSRAVCLALGLALVGQAAGFVRVQGTTFVDEDCHEFAFVGANTWRMLEAQAETLGVKINGKSPATALLDTSAALNISVLRVFASGTTPELPIQVKEGVYNDVALKALDQLMADAAARGLRITLILARNWAPPDSRGMYASWNGLKSPDDFYSSPDAKQAYKDHVTFMVNRVNTVTGHAYKDDPTIFSWNLMNEPRFFFNSSDDPCAKNPDNCTAILQSWIEEMAAHLRKEDPNHLITVGEEGFWSKSSPFAKSNPQPDSSWAVATGQDFSNNQGIPDVDYTEIHIWPDNWNVSTDFIKSWIASHMDAARQLGKPLVIEEFGKNVSSQDPAVIEKERNPVFETVMGSLTDSLKAGDVLKGAQYWMFDPVLVDEKSPGWGNYSQDQVFPSSTTMERIIHPAAVAAAEYSTQHKVPGCTPQAVVAPKAPSAAAAAPPGGEAAPKAVSASSGPAGKGGSGRKLFGPGGGS